MRRVRVKMFAVEKQWVLNILCVSVALVIQHAKCMRRIILSSVAWTDITHFSTSSHKQHNFQEKTYGTEEVCFDFLHKFYLSHFSL
jgi:hypothetical protein